MLQPWLKDKEIAGTRLVRGSSPRRGLYEGVVRVNGKVVRTCGCTHRNRDNGENNARWHGEKLLEGKA